MKACLHRILGLLLELPLVASELSALRGGVVVHLAVSTVVLLSFSSFSSAASPSAALPVTPFVCEEAICG